MKNIVRLTESDLNRLVRKVIQEQRLLNEGVCVSDRDVEDLRAEMARIKKTTASVELNGSCLYVTIGQQSYLL